MTENKIIVMDTIAASAWIADVGTQATRLRDLLYVGYQQKAWVALEYRTWGECLKAISDKFDLSLRHIRRLDSANQIQNTINNTCDQLVTNNIIPESQLRPLAELPPDQQRKAWETAVSTAPAGKVTGAHVSYTVKQILPDGQRGINRHDENLQNTIATCGVCGELYDGTAIGYCPYCAFTQEQRMAYVTDKQERPKVSHVSHATGENEWYTPPKYTEAARRVMGGIDLDPASSDIANRSIAAKQYYTEETDGLAWDWYGRVWMNPPYSQPLISHFCKKLADDLDNGFIDEAITLTNNATETKWFGWLARRCSAICFPNPGRIKFIDRDGNAGGAPLQGQAIMYFGPSRKINKFAKEFSEFGMVFYAR